MGARLSEIPSWSVIVMEAGQPETEVVDIPLLAVSFQGGMYDWGYIMEPQDNACFGLVDRRMPCPRGKAIGGTSVLNYMIYSRGDNLDYDELAKKGNAGKITKIIKIVRIVMGRLLKNCVRKNSLNYRHTELYFIVGWSYKDVLPYFIKSEDASNLYKAEWEYHGQGGPLSVEDTFQSSIVEAMMAGNNQL